MLLAQTIFWGICLSSASSSAKEENLQLRLSDSVSIYSEKAYRRDGGTIFEAIGNVVISSGQDTLYGERASFNTKSGQVEIEGSVRYIGENITIYGSKITYNTSSDFLQMDNARMITKDFSIVSEKLTKVGKSVYIALEAEFTTCKDCTESWKIFGKKVRVELNQYVQIDHALVKVKGIDVLYLPYIALPIKNKRESGLLFPSISTRNNEGVYFEQPVYWAISNTRDMTFSPLFYSERGTGLDLEFRDYYDERSWFEFSNKMINDKIYRPLEQNSEASGPSYFRHFYDLESHHEWDHTLIQHLRFTGTKDLDFITDYSFYTDNTFNRTDLGLDFNVVKRYDFFSLGFESSYKRNLLIDDPEEFDDTYVQVLPRISMDLKPIMLWQHQGSYFYKTSFSMASDYTVFKQNKVDESEYARNARRLDVSPALNFNLLNLGPFVLKTKYQLDYQDYELNEKEKFFRKNSGFISTEVNFNVDKIFGLSYEEIYDRAEIPKNDLEKISKQNKSRENVLSQNVVGKLPEFEGSVVREKIAVRRNSYRHSQEFKFIHHKLVHSGQSGDQDFQRQIDSEDGWFDYRDAITEDILTLESNESRKQIPLINTFEFQWNNTLVRKSPKNFNYQIDNKYLKDNFTYTKLGHFNISQGYLLNADEFSFKERLTRLYLDAGYSAPRWNLHLKDYYLHKSNDHIFTLSGERKFDLVSLLTQYNYNSFSDSSLKTLKAGIQFRPLDIIGFAVLKEQDLDADENISSIYQVDFMPNNNCWIFNLNYSESLDEKRYAFNFEFNFGNEDFKTYRTNFFNFSRLR